MGLFKNKNDKIIESKLMDKLREEELDRAILNPEFNSSDLRARMEKPVNVEYFSPNSIKDRTCMLHVTEVGELSTKDYILDPKGAISIGLGKENTIVLSDLSVGELKCEIRLLDGALGAKSNDTGKKIVLKRNNKNTYLGNEFIRILTGDEIIFGKTKLLLKTI